MMMMITMMMMIGCPSRPRDPRPAASKIDLW
jgi:hypothetical protein